MITGSWGLLPVLSHNQKKEGVHSHFSDEKMEAYEGDAHGFKDRADPRQLLTCQDKKSRPWEGRRLHARACAFSPWGAWVGEVQGCEGGRGRGGSSHSPLPAADVMLLHRIAKEGGPGARDDSGLLGVHVEGGREP